MIRELIVSLSLLSGTAHAQQLEENSVANEFAQGFVNSLSSGSEADCRSRLDSRKLLYQNENAGTLKPLRLVVEGHRLICERLRIEAEIDRLRSEKSRLITEVDRLNALWRSAASEEFLGRDRSQQIMLADVRGIEKVEQGLKVVVDDLHEEAIRILRLSVADVGRYSSQAKEVMRLAIDAEAQKSIFDGFRALLPKLG